MEVGKYDIPSRHPCFDLNLAILDANLVFCCHPRAHDRVDDCAQTRVRDGSALRNVVGSACPVKCQVKSIPIVDGLETQVVLRESRNNVHDPILNERIVVGSSGPLKLVIPEVGSSAYTLTAKTI